MLRRALSRRATIADLSAKQEQTYVNRSCAALAKETISTLWRSPDKADEVYLALKEFADMLEGMQDVSAAHDVMVSLIKCQGFRVLERAISKHIKNAEIASCGARALVKLLSLRCKDRAMFVSELTYIFGGDVLVRAMKYHSEDVDVISTWCDFAVLLLTEEKLIAVQLIRQGLSKVVIEAMERAPYSEKMQASACQVLPFLLSSADEATREKLMQIVFSALNVHFHSASVQKCGWEVLSVINYGTGKNDWEMFKCLGRRKALHLCTCSLQRHCDDEELVKRVRLVLTEVIESALSSDIHDFRAYLELGQFAAAGGSSASSDRAYACALKLLDESDTWSHTVLNSSRSWSCTATGRYETALQYATFCTESDATWALGWFRKGCALDRLGKSEEAVESLTRALELAKEPELEDEVQAALVLALEKMAAKWDAVAHGDESECASNTSAPVDPVDPAPVPAKMDVPVLVDTTLSTAVRENFRLIQSGSGL